MKVLKMKYTVLATIISISLLAGCTKNTTIDTATNTWTVENTQTGTQDVTVSGNTTQLPTTTGDLTDEDIKMIDSILDDIEKNTQK